MRIESLCLTWIWLVSGCGHQDRTSYREPPSTLSVNKNVVFGTRDLVLMFRDSSMLDALRWRQTHLERYAAHVEAKVLDCYNEAPIAVISKSMRGDNGSVLSVTCAPRCVAESGVIDSDGCARIEKVPPGTYDVSVVWRNAYSPLGCMQFALKTTEIVVMPGTTPQQIIISGPDSVFGNIAITASMTIWNSERSDTMNVVMLGVRGLCSNMINVVQLQRGKEIEVSVLEGVYVVIKCDDAWQRQSAIDVSALLSKYSSSTTWGVENGIIAKCAVLRQSTTRCVIR